MPLGRLLVQMSIPMMISFLIQALYNVVDSIFVAQISESALTAVSLAFPMQNVITAIGVGTGVGIMAQIPRALGLGNRALASKYANVSLLLNLCYWLCFLFFGTLFARPFYELQTADPEIVGYGVDYLSVVCAVSLGAFYGQTLEKSLTATGNALPAMISQAVGAGINLCFDPLLIFGLGPFPRMEVTGAAVATVFGQLVAAGVALAFNLRRNKAIVYRISRILPTRRILRDIYSVGVPSMITVGLASVMTFSLNQILLTFSTTAAAVFGVWIKLQSFAYMPVYGMNNGTVPILAYNFGAGDLRRVKGTIRLALGVGAGLMLALTALFECIPVPLMELFNASGNMFAIGVPALRITCLSLPFGGLCVIFSSAYQSLGHSRYTLWINLSRQMLVIVPLAWALSRLGVLGLVWWAAPLSELACLVLAVSLYPRLKRDVGI